jgi:hypothetical protein
MWTDTSTDKQRGPSQPTLPQPFPNSPILSLSQPCRALRDTLCSCEAHGVNTKEKEEKITAHSGTPVCRQSLVQGPHAVSLQASKRVVSPCRAHESSSGGREWRGGGILSGTYVICVARMRCHSMQWARNRPSLSTPASPNRRMSSMEYVDQWAMAWVLHGGGCGWHGASNQTEVGARGKDSHRGLSIHKRRGILRVRAMVRGRRMCVRVKE